MKEEWLLRGAVVPVDVETTAALVAEIKRLIDVVGGLVLKQGPDYERGFIDGMQKQAQSSVDRAVNRMAQPEQEPVAQIIALGQYEFPGLEWLSADHSFRAPIGTLLYTATAQRKPLTDEEIMDTWLKVMWAVGDRNKLPIPEFARAIEAAHGIKENT
jgi:hypothetical protein